MRIYEQFICVVSKDYWKDFPSKQLCFNTNIVNILTAKHSGYSNCSFNQSRVFLISAETSCLFASFLTKFETINCTDMLLYVFNKL